MARRRSSTSCSTRRRARTSSPRPGGRPGAPVHLLEDLNDKQTDLISEEKRLVENLQFLNAILSGESGIGGQKPTFHNSPRAARRAKVIRFRYPTMCRSPAVAPAPKRGEAEGDRRGEPPASRSDRLLQTEGKAVHRPPWCRPMHAGCRRSPDIREEPVRSWLSEVGASRTMFIRANSATRRRRQGIAALRRNAIGTVSRARRLLDRWHGHMAIKPGSATWQFQPYRSQHRPVGRNVVSGPTGGPGAERSFDAGLGVELDQYSPADGRRPAIRRWKGRSCRSRALA